MCERDTLEVTPCGTNYPRGHPMQRSPAPNEQTTLEVTRTDRQTTLEVPETQKKSCEA